MGFLFAFPFFFQNRESSFKGRNRENFDDTSHPKLVNLETLLQPNTGVVRRGTTTFTPIKHVGASPGVLIGILLNQNIFPFGMLNKFLLILNDYLIILDYWIGLYF